MEVGGGGDGASGTRRARGQGALHRDGWRGEGRGDEGGDEGNEEGGDGRAEHSSGRAAAMCAPRYVMDRA